MGSKPKSSSGVATTTNMAAPEGRCSDSGSRLSRRAALGAAAVFATIPGLPALADECRIGPPSHTKGPDVWMGLDQIELDAAYDQNVYAPLAKQITDRYATDSDIARKHVGEPLRVAYGPTEYEKLDIYPARAKKAPILVFIHGGAWLGGRSRDYGSAAEMLVDAGATYVALDFIAIREAGGDLRVMAHQVRRAIAWVYTNAASFGGDASGLYLAGHSSGAHLCGVALVADWAKQFSLPADIVKGAVVASGMFDMKPVRLSKRSSYVKFDDDMENAMSTQRHIDRLRCPVTLTYGGNETPEFKRQSRDFATALRAVGKPVEVIEAANYNHFEMGHSFANPYGPNGRAVLAMMQLRR